MPQEVWIQSRRASHSGDIPGATCAFCAKSGVPPELWSCARTHLAYRPKEVALDKLRYRLLCSDTLLTSLSLADHGMRVQDLAYVLLDSLRHNTVLRSLVTSIECKL